LKVDSPGLAPALSKQESRGLACDASIVLLNL